MTDMPLHTTYVQVKELPLLADIGINPDEIGRRQPLVITVKLTLKFAEVSAIEDTIDYRRITAFAEELAGEHTPLIETFAANLASRCLAHPAVVHAHVTVDKPFALTRGMAGVEVVMSR